MKRVEGNLGYPSASDVAGGKRANASKVALFLWKNEKMKTTMNGGAAAKSEAERLAELNRIDRPARKARLKLEHTLKVSDVTLSFASKKFVFDAPAWVEARGDYLWHASLIREWVRNARWIHDPNHGEFTRARFIRKWERVMEIKEAWMNRDRVPSVRTEFNFREHIADEIQVAAEFLQVSREMLLVGILASEALKRTAEDGPVWSDLQTIEATVEAEREGGEG